MIAQGRDILPGVQIPASFALPTGAPDILFALLGDVGFGAPSTVGGPCDASTLQKLADHVMTKQGRS